ncbi:hypothetical protein [Paenibacillus sp. PAMC21692]|uniref:hypothetical protein n=1 Tax=Paenibacillus sp. PAMC21692 TaxID=2762320 RepID=UPI00164D1126|nr:hypothetical protein [Paenibacillus sp. PAMC21692]QNK54698.1 hypothetical protein H7F31_18810 [Paenibacillus sp. PAMC21692]
MLIDLKPPKTLHGEMSIASELMVEIFNHCQTYPITDGKTKDKANFIKLYAKSKDCCLLLPQGEWIFNRVTEFINGVKNPALRADIIAAIRLDLDYAKNLDCSAFSFASYGIFAKLNEVEKAACQKIFGDFYDRFFSHKTSGGTMNNRHRFKEEYEAENRLVSKICPACLGNMDLGKAQLDHYFPKSHFPTLSVQPFNLVPVCSDCNSTVGSEEDKGKGNTVPTSPLDETRHNTPGCLKHIFIPYHRSGQKKIIAKVEGSPTHPAIRVQALQKESADTRQQVANHVATYKLDRVWTQKLPIVHLTLIEQAIVDLKSEYFRRKTEGHPPGEFESEELTHYLMGKYVFNSDKVVYRISDRFLLSNYAMWLTQSADAMTAFSKELNRRCEEEGANEGDVLPHYYEDLEEA